jgi:hypothetical protein
VFGTRHKAFHHKVHQPRETDAHGPTDPTQGDALAQQAFNQRALPQRNAPLGGLSDKLSWTRLALMILFPIMGMAIFLEWSGSTRRADGSNAHGSY